MRNIYLKVLDDFLSLFEHKSIFDQYGNEYIVFESNDLHEVDFDVDDKTAFEAFQNHIHISGKLRNISREKAVAVYEKLGNLLIEKLSINYPTKHFVVFITVSDSVIIRFHQKWSGEPWYYTIDEEYEGTRLLYFDN